MKKLQHVAMAALLGIVALPASAVQFDFYKLGRGPALDFRPSDGIACTGGDLCSSNVNGGVFNGDLTFTLGGITAHATSSFVGGSSAVIQDSQGGWTASSGAGLGVYHVKPVRTDDDNVTAHETLTITFDQAVKLSAIGLRADGHNFTSWATGSTFLFDGVSTALPKGVGQIGGLDVTGKTFTFAYGGRKADQFYLASMTVTPVPEPETYALMLAGLGLTGFIARRRTQRA